jgi:flagellar biosynthesis protein FlhF
MHLKRYRKSTVPDALAAVRQDLGPDALVLSTTLVPAHGWRGVLGVREVEVTAAVDRPLSKDRPPASANRPATIGGASDGLTARLMAAGFDARLARSVADLVPAEERRGLSDRRLRELVAQALEGLSAGQDPVARIEVFVGPPGVGKTTTIAKLAARESASGGCRFGMVAADGFRAGAVEQLRAYADIIGAPFRVARTPDELDRALAHLRSPMLVDTAGRSPNDGHVEELLQVAARRRGARTHLVVSADTSASAARRIFARYEAARPDRVVITKLDEAESASGLLTVIRERGLPVSFLTTGQRVPDDFARATPSLLASVMLGEPSSLQETHS